MNLRPSLQPLTSFKSFCKDRNHFMKRLLQLRKFKNKTTTFDTTIFIQHLAKL
ncbi:hypothetical protein BCR33DRAFT_715181 [Rhizoclosmatium globosum]|uniref:Uncharacterized protein n=1 Tax=Rhizoclosmatium globosum TaxID=329046 RepID=A0A1Y2CKF7_9FUNG|nr:hypothetical protein BCR33DRAFT_715181 [Rhizoclosmatium globosum]|eukprot:ORY47480.1 hypothetical protein BCR33DRAFT_715181 [Rhizoclosmatium globosum]